MMRATMASLQLPPPTPSSSLFANAVRGITLAAALSLLTPSQAATLSRSSLGLPTDDLSKRSARELAAIYCGACHLQPEPHLLDRKTWEQQTLPRMLARVGLAPEVVENNPESALLKASGAFPESPLLPMESWNRIVDFYLSNAPTEAIPQDPKPEIRVGLKSFQKLPSKFRTPTPSTSLVKILPSRHEVLLGDDLSQSLYLLNARGELQKTLPITNNAVAAVESPKGYLIAAIGNFQPAETPRGEVLFLGRENDQWSPKKRILHPLPRTTDIATADLNHDGKEDFALCQYGNVSGAFSWFENLGNDQYREQVLIPKSGAIRVVAHDFNKDGSPDLAVLMAQETEALFILINDRKGHFTPHQIFQKHPLFGHTYFEVADFNKDGLPDLIVTNGDNGEYTSPLKKYHGVRIYLNRGGLKFEEAYFYPLNGAFKAVARDFDGDGDLDLATISFFPDYNTNPRESFVFLENLGDFKFEASTFRECIGGRWLTLDAADLDGDGADDLVLGSYIKGPSPVPRFLMENWQNSGPSAVILMNTSKKAK